MVCPGPEVLTRYLYEEMGADEAAGVRAHVEGCEACRQGIEAGHALDRALRLLPPLATDPPSRAECLDAVTLAAWIDAGLSEADRARAEEHLARCGACQDDLVEAAERPEPARQSVPGPLAEQALALARSATGSTSPRRLPRLRAQWRWAALAAVLVAGALLWARGTPPAEEALRLARGPGFARRPLSARTDLVAGGILRIDAELARALRAYGDGPSAEKRVVLLRALERGPLAIPAGRVVTVAINPSFLARIREGAAPEARVALLLGGRLLIEEP